MRTTHLVFAALACALTANTSFARDVDYKTLDQEILAPNSCITCHAGPNGWTMPPDLDEQSIQRIIDFQNPEQSRLYQSVKEERMPPRSPLDAAGKQTVLDYVLTTVRTTKAELLVAASPISLDVDFGNFQSRDELTLELDANKKLKGTLKGNPAGWVATLEKLSFDGNLLKFEILVPENGGFRVGYELKLLTDRWAKGLEKLSGKMSTTQNANFAQVDFTSDQQKFKETLVGKFETTVTMISTEDRHKELEKLTHLEFKLDLTNLSFTQTGGPRDGRESWVRFTQNNQEIILGWLGTGCDLKLKPTFTNGKLEKLSGDCEDFDSKVATIEAKPVP